MLSVVINSKICRCLRADSVVPESGAVAASEAVPVSGDSPDSATWALRFPLIAALLLKVYSLNVAFHLTYYKA